MQKKLKRLAVVPVALALSLSSFSAAFADQAPIFPTQPPVIETETPGEGDGPIITPFEVQLISPLHYTGVPAYENSFTMDPLNGTDANLWIKNNSSAKIYMKIYKNGVEQFEVPFDAGEQKTSYIYTTVTNTYKIYVFSKTGHSLDFNVSARQY